MSKVLYWQAEYVRFLPDTPLAHKDKPLYLCFIICNMEGKICSKAVLDF